MAYTHCEPECQAKCKDISLTECNSAPFRDSRVCEAECIPMIDDLDLTNAVPAAKRDENSVPEMIPPPGFYPPFPNPILLDVCKGITKDGKANIVPANEHSIAFGRTTQQVHNIAYLNPASGVTQRPGRNSCRAWTSR